MDVDKLAIDLLLKGMTQEQQTAALESIKDSVTQAKAVQKQRIGENVQVVVQALKKLEADIRARYDETGKAIEKRVASIKDGQDGRNGTDGKAGKDGRPGRDGTVGPKGADGINGNDGRDGENGVSVTDAHIDFDGSLVISLSSGRTINVGEVVAPDLAEKIKVITNGGGTSQTVIDTLASLQTQIDNLIPSQTGNSGKFLTTNGSVLSWAQVAGGLSYQGTWNASTNTPTLASGVGVNGYYYITATAGSTNLDGITDWQIGDWLMFNGTVWQKIDQSNLVTSVNGQTGAVSLTSTNISEGTNLYYTDARARASVSAGTGISYSSATGVITNAAPDQTVALTAGTGISTTGTYPNFTIANTAPDQTVVLTQGGTTTITGTYPNFTISSDDQYDGTVTSVSGTGTVNGISLSGTVTSSGSLTLGGTLDLSSPPAIGNTAANTGAFTTLTSSSGATLQGLTVGRGAGAVSTNTAVGASALAANTSGAQNTVIGNQAGATTNAAYLTAVGYQAARYNTGDGNTAIGTNALLVSSGVNGTGSNNTAIGKDALIANTTASNNTAVGYQAGYSNTTGTRNAAFGMQSLYANTTGNYNAALSYDALQQNTTGSSNTAVGYQSLISNTTASANTAVGFQALYKNVTGTANTSLGQAAGYNGTGSYNTYIGDSSGPNMGTDYAQTYNTFIGQGSGSVVQTGTKNTILGRYTGNQGGLDIRTASNYIVLSDGDGNPRTVVDGSGNFRSTGTGSATLYPEYKCRAWVNFNGTGTVAIRASGNVSSITDNGTGDYTVNFTTAMPDANYGWSVDGNFLASYNYEIVGPSTNAPTTSAFRLTTGAGSLKTDLDYVSLAIFR